MTTALDRLTAERVMGWPTIDFSQSPPATGYIRAGAAYHGSDHPRRCETFEPSTDPRDTFAVVDKLRAEGWRLTLEDSVAGYDAMFIERDAEEVLTGRIFYGTHEDRLTAILLAALAVKGVSDDEVQAALKEGA